MATSLEPIVTISQELKVTEFYVTIGSMSEENEKFSRRLNIACDQYGIPPKGAGRQLELAKLFDVSQKGARKWLEGESIPKSSRLIQIAKTLGVDHTWLSSGQIFAPNQNVEMREPAEIYRIQSQVKKIPIISTVQAGNWKEESDNYHPGDADEWMETSASVSSSAFALRVEGDSMQNPHGVPSIPDGAVVIVDPEMAPTNGKIVVAKLTRENKTVLKKLIIDGPNTYLKSLNPEYKTIQIDSDCIIIGVAKKLEIDL